MPSLLLLVRNGSLRTLACSSICFCALTTNRETPSVAQAAVRADFDQSLNIERGIAAEVTLYAVALIDIFT